MKLNYVFFGVFCRILHGNRCELYRCFIGILYKRLFSIYHSILYSTKLLYIIISSVYVSGSQYMAKLVLIFR